jgi:hypothetical protein
VEDKINDIECDAVGLEPKAIFRLIRAFRRTRMAINNMLDSVEDAESLPPFCTFKIIYKNIIEELTCFEHRVKGEIDE